MLVVAQLLLIMASWIITAAMPELNLRSILSPEGIRWFFGHFAGNILSSLLVSLILLLIGYGSVKKSGLWNSLSLLVRKGKLRYVDRVGLWVVAGEVLIAVVMVILLTCVPHAILLSVTGHLFPSSFSQSLVSIIAVVLLVCGLTFGVVSGRLSSIGMVYEATTYGLVHYAWLFPIYIFAVELYYSVLFVFPALG